MPLSCLQKPSTVGHHRRDEAMGNPRVGAEGGVEQPGQKALQNRTTDLKENPGTAQ